MVPMKELLFWKYVSDQLHKKQSVMLIVVVDYEKGSPGKTGFKIAVTKEGSFGTIGGGVMEFNLIQSSRNYLIENQKICVVKKLVHNPKTTIGEPSGLICAGSQTICMISLNIEDVEGVDKVLLGLQEHSPGHFFLSQQGLSFSSKIQATHHFFQFTNEQQWKYDENLGAEYTAYIIGGGHVGLATARVIQSLEFNIVLIDDRSDAPAIIEKGLSIRKIVSPYNEIGKFIEPSEKNFVAIVTSAMQSDTMALRSLIGKKLGYIGLMGTEAKIAKIVNAFTAKEKQTLGKIHAPIGVDIQSRTVEEIAISIAAEMIQAKNQTVD